MYFGIGIEIYKYIDSSDLYIVLPITMVAAYRDANATIAPGTSSSALCSIKTNFLNLIHQCDLQINGKTIESTTSFINIARAFLSRMCTPCALTLNSMFAEYAFVFPHSRNRF